MRSKMRLICLASLALAMISTVPVFSTLLTMG